MEARIDIGRLVERPTATGIARQAFGEFVGPGGELASYAVGWATDTSPVQARLTVGIGAGDAGGGTFHARVFEHDGDHAFGLIDEPFVEVAQGGRHLTAAQARRHVDLPFVWWVGDFVMERDPRALWMSSWLLGSAALVTPSVLDSSAPVMLVVHDDDDLPVEWQLIAPDDAGDEGMVMHLSHAVDHDPTLAQVLDLEPGQQARRRRVGGPWTRS